MSKIQFGGVHLDHEVDRLGGAVGVAYAHTSYFRASSAPVPGNPRPQSYTIALDTDTGLVTITAESGAAIVVPRDRVKRFEPLPPSGPDGTVPDGHDGDDACADHDGDDTCADHDGDDACADHDGNDACADHDGDSAPGATLKPPTPAGRIAGALRRLR